MWADEKAAGAALLGYDVIWTMRVRVSPFYAGDRVNSATGRAF